MDEARPAPSPPSEARPASASMDVARPAPFRPSEARPASASMDKARPAPPPPSEAGPVSASMDEARAARGLAFWDFARVYPADSAQHNPYRPASVRPRPEPSEWSARNCSQNRSRPYEPVRPGRRSSCTDRLSPDCFEWRAASRPPVGPNNIRPPPPLGPSPPRSRHHAGDARPHSGRDRPPPPRRNVLPHRLDVMSFRRDMLSSRRNASSPRRDAPPPACLYVPAPPRHDARRFHTSDAAGASNSNVPRQADTREHLNRQRAQREQQSLSRKGLLDAIPPVTTQPVSSCFPAWPDAARKQLLKFAQKPVIGVALAANKPWGGFYRGRGANGIARPGSPHPHIAADRSQFVDLLRFLRKLGFGNASSKAKLDAGFPLLVEPLHDLITFLLIRATCPPRGER
eukprot:6211827-Pleurochrysis_carterae.AAC.2